MSASSPLSYLGYGVVFVVMISILVAAHEYGHYLFARIFNMGVEEFAIGFGKRPLITWMRRSYIVPILPGEDPDLPSNAPRSSEGGVSSFAHSLEGGAPGRKSERIDTPTGPALRETTDFTFRAWPLGGFARIKGMLPDEDGSEVRIPGGFYSKPPWQRFLVLLAGPLFSVLAGILIIIPALIALGETKNVNKPILGEILAGMPADQAGLKMGDQVLSVDGQKVPNFYSVVAKVRFSTGAPLDIELKRGDHVLTARVTPVRDTAPTQVMGPDLELLPDFKLQYKLGVRPPTVTEPLGFGGAFLRAVELPYIAVSKVIETFTRPKEFSDNVGGPVTMYQATAGAVQSGFWQVMELAGLLSISVGVFNLLPAHPLDGGQMVMAIAEMLRGGRRLSIRAQVIAGGIGLTFVAVLVLSVFLVDIKRLAGGMSKSEPSHTAPATPAHGENR